MGKQLPPHEDEIVAWMNSAGKYRMLSNEETLEIAKKIKECSVGSNEYSRLVNKLTVHNLRLVIKFVTNFMRTRSRKKFGCSETVDYLQVGALGLRRAVELYDPYSGFRLSTYAYPWIRSFVSRYNLRTCSIFHIPENALSDTWKFQKQGFLARKDGTQKDKQQCLNLVANVSAALSVSSIDDIADMDSGDPVPFSSLIEDRRTFTESGKFPYEIEDLIASCELSELQTEILRSLYLYEMGVVKTSKAYDLTPDKVSRLRDSALNVLKSADGLV